MVSKRSERPIPPIHKLPSEPAITLSANALEEAAADLYGFRVRETWKLLQAKRETLAASRSPKARVMFAVVAYLADEADVALDLNAAWNLEAERWALAVEAGAKALAAFRAAWENVAQIHVRELYIDAGHSVPDLRKNKNRHAEHIQKLIDQGVQLHLDLQGLRRDLPRHGLKLERWQALLRKAGFTWSEVVSLFKHAPGRDGTAEAARKRVARLLKDQDEANWIRDRFKRLTTTKKADT